MRKVKQIKVVCKTCGKIFDVQPSEVRKSKKLGYEVGYCSRDCFSVAHKKLARERGGFVLGKHWTHTEDYKKRLSLARTGDKNPMFGKIASILTRKKLSKSLKKAHREGRHPIWKGGITPKNIAIRDSVNYKLWREAVFKRDDYECQECGETKSGSFNAHHIKFFSKYPKFRFIVSNGVTLCVECHKYIHCFERQWERSLNEQD